MLLFKLGIANTRHFAYEGPWAEFVDWLEAVVTRAGLVPAGIPPDVNIEFALYPLLGGILTTLILYATKALSGKDFGPPLSGQLEDFGRGNPPTGIFIWAYTPDVRILYTSYRYTYRNTLRYT